MKKLLLCLFLIGQYGIVHTAQYTQEQSCRDIVEFFKNSVLFFKKIINKDREKVKNFEMLPFDYLEKNYRSIKRLDFSDKHLQALIDDLGCENLDWFNEELENLYQELSR